jgi:hypothetical protein
MACLKILFSIGWPTFVESYPCSKPHDYYSALEEQWFSIQTIWTVLFIGKSHGSFIFFYFSEYIVAWTA